MTRTPLPAWVLVAATVGLTVVAVPLLGLAVRIPWADVPTLLTSTAATQALWLSLRTCTLSMLLATVLGLPVAMLLARLEGRRAVLVRTLAVLPMVLPPVVAGLVLLVTLGRRGVVGQHLAAAGIEIGFTTAAVVIAQTFVAMPFFIVSVEGALRTLDPAYEVAAATLGASPTTVLRRVTLPMVGPAVLAGMTMAFARSLGEFGATLAFAGSLQGTTRTMPLEIYLQRETDTDSALALSLVLIVLAAVLMALPAGVRALGSRGGRVA
ncbi:ABC transporter permease [Aestuariimicrobium ganziense]|uniref:ABC transporter permease n=1 Tax=Aestuariimicrobium ganziense TaxID=2773677 RepID=UPI002E2B857B|nr:ABC transporter permease [Aestuariimicrobium ganziense]